MQTLFDSPGHKVPFEQCSVDFRFEADKQAAIRLSRENHPRFGFAVRPRGEGFCLSIVRVNLDRQCLCGIEKLEQQRELFAARVPAEQFIGMLADQVVQRSSIKRAAEDAALIVAEIDDLPALSPTDRVGIRLAPLLSQSPAAPRACLNNGCKRSGGIVRITFEKEINV